MPELFPSTTPYINPPAPDELEVSVIGPGFGECCLVHVGDNHWLVVDCCTHPDAPDPAPLRYLNDLGVGPEHIELVTITHWDDDHCRGISDLVRACPNAHLAMSPAFVDKDFLAFVAIHASPLTKHARAGVKQIKEVVEFVRTSGLTIRSAAPARRLLSQFDVSLSHGLPFECWTLSPSDEEFQNFLIWAAQQMPAVGETRRVAVKRLRNDLSVVLHISVGEDTILLGGDLEEEGKPTTGWSAVIGLTGRPTAKASVFKIPHHGSVTAHHNQLPSTLLASGPIGIIAPFKNGSVSLPTAADITRINGYAPNSYGTATLKGRGHSRKDATVEKAIREVTDRYSEIKIDPGMVRLRKQAGSADPWTVELFGSAVSLLQIP